VLRKSAAGNRGEKAISGAAFAMQRDVMLGMASHRSQNRCTAESS
jgi:hypothetical protein